MRSFLLCSLVAVLVSWCGADHEAIAQSVPMGSVGAYANSSTCAGNSTYDTLTPINNSGCSPTGQAGYSFSLSCASNTSSSAWNITIYNGTSCSSSDELVVVPGAGLNCSVVQTAGAKVDCSGEYNFTSESTIASS